MAFSPDGTRILTGSRDHTAKLGTAKTGKPLLEFKGHTDQIRTVAFSPDGTRVATGSWDKSAKVWDAQTGTLLLNLTGAHKLCGERGIQPGRHAHRHRQC